MLKMALIGKDVSRSDSAKMHRFTLRQWGEDCTYDLVSVTPERFHEEARRLLAECDAFNVTIPYKLEIIPMLACLHGDASVFGAVNTVVGGEGYNTDGAGFMLMLENEGIACGGATALVLGAGGAGRSVVKKLSDAGARVSLYDVRRENVEAVCKEFGGIAPLSELPCTPFDLIVNATGVGMHRTEGISPVDAALLRQCGAAIDLIYYPRQSEFLRIAASLGKRTCNGEGMLYYQAYYADCIALGRRPSPSEARALFDKYRNAEQKEVNR